MLIVSSYIRRTYLWRCWHGDCCAGDNDCDSHSTNRLSHNRKTYTANVLYRNFETYIPRNETAPPRSQFLLLCVCERFIYSHERSAKTIHHIGGPMVGVRRRPGQNRVTWKTPSTRTFVPLQEPVSVLASYVPHTQMPVWSNRSVVVTVTILTMRI